MNNLSKSLEKRLRQYQAQLSGKECAACTLPMRPHQELILWSGKYHHASCVRYQSRR